MTNPSDESKHEQRVEIEEFRFRDTEFENIVKTLVRTGAVLVATFVLAAALLGLFSTEARGAGASRVLGNVVVLALLIMATLLFVAGLILLFAEVKKTSVTVTDTPPVDGRVESLTGTAVAKVLEVTADGLSKVKGGSAAIFGGIVLLVVAGWAQPPAGIGTLRTWSTWMRSGSGRRLAAAMWSHCEP